MHTSCVIIGAGHSGLAMSHCLSACSVDHVVLERGEIANSWKQERWDSLRLLTPNWQARLPGYAYQGDNPDGYMGMPEVINFMESYADFISAPVEENTTVTSVSHEGSYYQVATNQGRWQCDTLVVASGACNRVNIPAVAEQVPADIEMLTPMQYRNPEQLLAGGVLVVGASATGLQLAEEIHRSGRSTTLAVGEHVRLPRTYRGRDIQYWLHALGILDEAIDDIDDLVRGRNIPSPQLVGTPERITLDLNRLAAIGVKLRGRLAGINAGKAQFSGSLANVCQMADLKMNRLLNRIDEFVIDNEPDGEVAPTQRFDETGIEDSPPLFLDFAKQGIKTILWATGYSPDYTWLEVPVLDRKGRIRHQGGVVDSPGMYLMGTSLLRRRKSSFIHGAEDDARELGAHLLAYLNEQYESKKKLRRLLIPQIETIETEIRLLEIRLKLRIDKVANNKIIDKGIAMTESKIFVRSSGEGDNIVCLHSCLGSSKQWYGLMNRLEDSFCVSAIDLYGYGKGPKWNLNKPISLQDEVKLVAALMDTMAGPVPSCRSFIRRSGCS